MTGRTWGRWKHASAPALPGQDGGGPVVELSWTARPSQRGRRIAQRAVCGLVAWCGEIGITEVWARVDVTNPASLRVAAAAGFERVTEAEGWVYLCAATR